jgi:ATP-dependent Clp protease protease subunit
MSGTTLMSQTYPGGCYIGFNAAIDRKSAEQLCFIVTDAKKHGFRTVNLCMSSVGGVLDHTYYAFNILEALDLHFVSWNVGGIQSAATILFMCGDERYATADASFFFHQTSYDPPSTRINGPYLVEKLKAVRYDDTRSAGILASKTGKPVQDVRGWQNTELVMNTDAALAHGLIHGVRALIIPADALFHQVVV